MKQQLKAVWRRLPTPARRAAHLTVGVIRRAPGAVVGGIGAAAAQLGQAIANIADEWRQAVVDGAQAVVAIFEPTYADLAERWRLFRIEARARRLLPRSLGAPITVVGFHGAVHGLGEGARLLAAGFKAAGLTVRSIDLSADVGFAQVIPVPDPPPGPRDNGVVISHINPPELLKWIQKDEGETLNGRWHIGYWAWELETVPADWLPAFSYVDEVWCPSDYTARAVRAAAPRQIKVRTTPYPIYLKPLPAPDRARFDLPEDRCVVLMSFDLKSTDARKNPYGALRAFAAAAARTTTQPLLICKIVGADLYPTTLATLREIAAGLDGVRIMTDEVSPADMAVLLASCDVVLSLHRSEGYGLLMAEGMHAGKAVVATGWSSNAEFMDPDATLPVAYELIPVQGNGEIYHAGRWAAADEADAADKLLALFDDPAYRQALGEAARHGRHLSFDAERWPEVLKGYLKGRP
jgi:glycosyltransferase involved in cell wall biosynthesis